MRPAEFQELAERFAQGPVMPRAGQRHIYLWHGELDAAEACLAHGTVARLDLHKVAGALARRPVEPEGARRVLEKAIEQALCADDAARRAQQVVVVTGCDLLMRYRASLGALFQAACDSRMIILVAPPYSPPAQPLPRYVDFRADATFDYLRSRLSDAAVIQCAHDEARRAGHHHKEVS